MDNYWQRNLGEYAMTLDDIEEWVFIKRPLLSAAIFVVSVCYLATQIVWWLTPDNPYWKYGCIETERHIAYYQKIGDVTVPVYSEKCLQQGYYCVPGKSGSICQGEPNG